MTSRQKSIIKYVCAAILLVIILHNTDIAKIGSYLGKVSPFYLIIALCFTSLAQVAAALRMRYFFHAGGYPLTVKFALILFYVGAFYNFLLPGGISGDAYKVMLARKRLDMPTMKGVKLMVADRASGLCILMMLMFCAFYTMDLSALTAYAHPLIIAAAVITVISYLVISKLLLGLPPRAMLLSLYYSLGSQAMWVATLYVLWKSLSNSMYFIEYIALYCAASIAALLPVSVGGLGIKESTYYYGAATLRYYTNVGVDGELGVALSLCIFALLFIGSLPGIFWLHKIGHAEFRHGITPSE